MLRLTIAIICLTFTVANKISCGGSGAFTGFMGVFHRQQGTLVGFNPVCSEGTLNVGSDQDVPNRFPFQAVWFGTSWSVQTNNQYELKQANCPRGEVVKGFKEWLNEDGSEILGVRVVCSLSSAEFDYILDLYRDQGKRATQNGQPNIEKVCFDMIVGMEFQEGQGISLSSNIQCGTDPSPELVQTLSPLSHQSASIPSPVLNDQSPSNPTPQPVAQSPKPASMSPPMQVSSPFVQQAASKIPPVSPIPVAQNVGAQNAQTRSFDSPSPYNSKEEVVIDQQQPPQLTIQPTPEASPTTVMLVQKPNMLVPSSQLTTPSRISSPAETRMSTTSSPSFTQPTNPYGLSDSSPVSTVVSDESPSLSPSPFRPRGDPPNVAMQVQPTPPPRRMMVSPNPTPSLVNPTLVTPTPTPTPSPTPFPPTRAPASVPTPTPNPSTVLSPSPQPSPSPVFLVSKPNVPLSMSS